MRIATRKAPFEWFVPACPILFQFCPRAKHIHVCTPRQLYVQNKHKVLVCHLILPAYHFAPIQSNPIDRLAITHKMCAFTSVQYYVQLSDSYSWIQAIEGQNTKAIAHSCTEHTHLFCHWNFKQKNKTTHIIFSIFR